MAITTIGHYELSEEIAQTACGAVYRGVERTSDEAVVVKVAPRGVGAFRASPQSLAGLHHPQIVPIREVFHSPDGESVLVQNVPAGQTLADSLAHFDGQYRQIAHFVRDAAIVLGFAHAEGVTHGDISLRTLLIGEADEPLFSEFGLGPPPSQQPQAGVQAAAPMSASESDSHDRAFKRDERADIYALGAVLYAMLSGKWPTDRPLAALSDPDGPGDDIPPIDIVAPEAPTELRAICSQALSTDPVHRYLHAETLARDLDRYLVGRKPGRAGTLVFVAVAALTVLLFSLWGATGGGPARIVDVAILIGEDVNAPTLQSADGAMSHRNPIRVRARLSKPASVSVFYRDPTGRVTRVGQVINDVQRQIVIPEQGTMQLPETGGMGVLIVASHVGDVAPEEVIEAALVTAGAPPSMYTPVSWTGRSLSIPPPQTAPGVPAGEAATNAEATGEYADKVIRAIETDVDDAVVGVLYVVGL